MQGNILDTIKAQELSRVSPTKQGGLMSFRCAVKNSGYLLSSRCVNYGRGAAGSGRGPQKVGEDVLWHLTLILCAEGARQY